MEYRRCRKVVAVILTTVFILSLFGQSVSAAPEKPAGAIYNRVLTWKQNILGDVSSDFKTMLASVSQSQYVKNLKDKLVTGKNQAEKSNVANEIVFVIEQIPLEQVLGKNPSKENGEKVTKVQSTVQRQNTVTAMEMSRGSGPKALQEELELLARIIYAEARGESFEGQVAVGAVVLNRVEHPAFPKTIKEVIYQPGQFTAVKDRQIELTPNETAYRAAQAALEGYDPSDGAIFYYNPKTATDSWIRTRSEVKRIGNHKFCI